MIRLPVGSQSRSGACKSPSGGLGLVLLDGTHERVVLHHPSSLLAAQRLLGFQLFVFSFPRLPTFDHDASPRVPFLSFYFSICNIPSFPSLLFQFISFAPPRHTAPRIETNDPAAAPHPYSPVPARRQTSIELVLMPRDQHEPIQSIPGKAHGYM